MELSHREIVDGIASRVVRIVDAMLEQRTGTAGIGWDRMEEADRQAYRHEVHRILRMRGFPIEDIHADRVDEWSAAGWTRAFTHDPETRESPLLRPFGELPLTDRQEYAVIVATVRALYED